MPGFVEDLEPLPGAIEGFKELVARPKFDTYICSACSGEPECAKGKLIWIKENLPFFDTKKSILCGDKYLIQANILLDDGVEKLTAYRDYMLMNSNIEPTPVVMTAPHNFENEDIPLRVNNMQEFNELLKVIA